jgi:hypothetical protein
MTAGRKYEGGRMNIATGSHAMQTTFQIAVLRAKHTARRCAGRAAPQVWFGVVPPTPKCESCGAVKRDHGPVIDMKPKKPRYDWMDHAAGFSVIDKLLGR